MCLPVFAHVEADARALIPEQLFRQRLGGLRFPRSRGTGVKQHTFVYNYLKKHSPTVINVMRIKGTLEQYLIDLDRDAQDTFERMIGQYAEIEGVTEALKAEDNLEWTRRMNSIRNRVEEFILSDFVYA